MITINTCLKDDRCHVNEEAETIHAFGYFASLDGVKSTQENLEYAINGETYDHVWST